VDDSTIAELESWTVVYVVSTPVMTFVILNVSSLVDKTATGNVVKRELE